MLLKIALAFFLTSSILLSQPLINIKYEYYDVYPSETKSIYKAMDEATPLLDHKTPIYGVVSWYVNYDYKKIQEKNICKIDDVQTELNIRYIIPQLPNDYEVSEDIKEDFRIYSETLNSNLGRFKKIAVNCAKKLEKELSLIPDKNNCHKITKNAYVKGKRIILRYRKEQKNLALKTFNGYLEKIK